MIGPSILQGPHQVAQKSTSATPNPISLSKLSAKEVGDEAVVAKVNVDEAQQLAAKYNVRSIPAIFVLKGGEVVNQFVGVQDKQTLVNAIKSAK